MGREEIKGRKVERKGGKGRNMEGRKKGRKKERKGEEGKKVRIKIKKICGNRRKSK